MIKYDYSVDLNNESSATKLIRLLGMNKKVLEIGCSTGYMSKVMSEEYNAEVTGLEINSEAAQQAKPYCKNVIVGNIETLDINLLPENYYDVIIFADVLEHLYNPIDVLKRLSLFLKDDGYILASIPNINHFSIIMEMINNRFNYNTTGLLDSSHIRFFSLGNVLKMFANSGFQVTHLDRVIKTPDDTEFKTNMASIPKEVASYICQQNSESNTYQFICRAFKTGAHSDLSNIVELKKGIDYRDEVIASLNNRIIDLENRLKDTNEQLVQNQQSKTIKGFLRKFIR